jgi:DNA polymerase-3 subunit beta
MVREGTQGAQLVLPIRGLRELGRVLSSCESEDPVRILVDGAQAFFQFPGGEFSVRRIDTKFPAYEKFLAKDRTTWMVMDKDALLAAVERMDLIVRDFTRMVVLQLSPAGNLHISAQAPEVGDAMEELDAEIDGEPLRIAFNVRFLLDGLKAVSGTLVHLSFNGSVGQMTMSRPDDDAFLYVAMPIALSEEDVLSGENAL